MLRLFCLFAILFSFLSPPMQAQSAPPSSVQEYEKSYDWRVRQEILYGAYIPNDLGEVFVQLDRLSEKSDQAKFARLSEQQAATVPFFGLGRWISHNWGFYGGSRLTVYLNQLNLHHPDDMTRFLLVMYHRHLNKKALDPQPVVEGLLKTRAAKEKERLLQGEVIHEESRTLSRDSSRIGGRK
ncbi:MAG: DUF6794 domain-containing protein [Bacteroidota bacterium]